MHCVHAANHAADFISKVRHDSTAKDSRQLAKLCKRDWVDAAIEFLKMTGVWRETESHDPSVMPGKAARKRPRLDVPEEVSRDPDDIAFDAAGPASGTEGEDEERQENGAAHQTNGADGAILDRPHHSNGAAHLLNGAEAHQYQMIRSALIEFRGSRGGIPRAADRVGLSKHALLRRLAKWPELRDFNNLPSEPISGTVVSEPSPTPPNGHFPVSAEGSQVAEGQTAVPASAVADSTPSFPAAIPNFRMV